MVNASFHKMDIPSGKEVCRRQFFNFMDKLISTDISHGDYETYLPDLMEKFANVTKEEVLQRVAALEFDHFLKYYQNAEDLNAKDAGRRPMNNERSGDRASSNREGSRNERSFNRRDNGYTRLFLNLGTKDGFYKASMLQVVLDESNLNKESLGKIDLRDMNTWIECDTASAAQMISALDGKRYNNRTVRMNEADGGFKRPNDEGNSRDVGSAPRERKRVYGAGRERR